MKKMIKSIKIFCKNIAHLVDKKIILPVTKIIFNITSKFDNSGRKQKKGIFCSGNAPNSSKAVTN